MKVSEAVTRVVSAENIQEDELRAMVRDSSPYSHEWANRRWYHWIFKYDRKSDTLERMAVYLPESHGSVMWGECSECDGAGCSHCGWLGEVPQKIC